ncbi:helix-turn-helix transcriptional regulator [Bradyrhizobium elkanii]|uniref:DNA-binding CsgD family transcriptional regulator n=1 Tax=Bradyrhizobium elkanii TaxID=29448 RepID=A0ABV4EYN5_BRAEL|nr:LuxR family transcriptional regulator [Bradyrhizobium elkanii]MCP1757304.1 DNA-binding CsgD family transcriptional regulator [Bradyrhizobium elkanii]MCP1982817.1 DNA-binding CsgD family transcriptional regulator [Bradyrhizobium elkanii]MCS3691205.1 DNA-binding CsgD family transcriptional regulator [Bradyrhizobium elkanii]MCS3882399.1 DNA-binding CsgD family transcriptional regulator [Bradyrhizobium elkanii]MCS4219158.1 DNA-binding CsgD family transcriptional regulator [Bradyrhizobium elkani
MTPHIRDITSNELKLFGDIIHRLQRLGAQDDVRRAVLPDLVQLLRADGGCSCTWLETNQRFGGSIYVGAAPDIPSLYDDWYQFRDPITSRLRAARRATIVDDVMDRRDLTRTEFYNDFLQRDALEWGINIYMFDQRDRDLGDFRIWRRHGKANFDDREKVLLDVMEPFIRSALLRGRTHSDGLTAREREVTELISRGCTDRDIARVLGISFGTVRTHISRVLEKLGCANRAELAANFTKARSPANSSA